jgi:hypothetical protein
MRPFGYFVATIMTQATDNGEDLHMGACSERILGALGMVQKNGIIILRNHGVSIP